MVTCEAPEYSVDAMTGVAGAGDGPDRAVRFEPHPDVLSRRVDDEFVLVNMRTNEIFALNVTGARLWELLRDGHQPDAALDVLLAEFEVGEDELRREVEAFLGLLEREGLLSRTAA
jgi:hypothetical protein